MPCAQYGGEVSPHHGSGKSRAAGSRNGHSAANNSTSTGAVDQLPIDNQHQERPACAFEGELILELLFYGSFSADAEGYRPGPFSTKQLRKAAIEFHKRWVKSENAELPDDISPFVVVSRGCSKIPSNGTTRSALQGIDGVDKLWYYLSEGGDLFIVKLASGPAHGAGVVAVTTDLDNFSRQYRNASGKAFGVISDGRLRLAGGGTFAPDGVLQRTHPPQRNQTSARLRAPLVVELELGNRDPKAMMLQLNEYIQQPQSVYVLGIKIYKRQGLVQKSTIPAVAILWRRSHNALASHPVVGVWNFGTRDLDPKTKSAFCRGAGNLEAPLPNSFQHNPANANVTIPAAHLVQGVQYPDGNNVQLLQNGNDLTVDLTDLLESVSHFM